MIKYCFASILLFLALSSNAQVIIDSTSMPVPGDTIKYRSTSNLTGINYQQTDTAFIWDFSALLSDEEVADTFVTVNSTNLAYAAVFNSFLDPENKATVAQPVILTQTIPMISITEVFNFYKDSYNRFSMLGFGAKVESVPIPMKFNNPDVLYNFPVTYGSRDTSDSEVHTNIPSIGYYGHSVHRENYVDGWGTLYLPADTFEVIRVKSKVTYFDTIYYDSIGMGGGFNRNETEYKWLADGFHGPVLQITKSGQNNVKAKYFNHIPIDLSVKPVESLNPVEIYPNPAINIITIKIPSDNNDITLTVTDISGREIISKQYWQNISEIKLSVEQLQKGLYFIGLTTASAKYSGKFIKF